MKQEQRRYVSQELILAEAIKEFGKYGYGDASVNRICEAGQISKGRLFHYYKDKDELFLTCVQACYDHLQQVQEFFRAEPEEALEQTFHRYFRLRQQHFQNHPYEALMMRVAALSSPAHLKERTDQMMDHFVDATSRVLYQILANVQPALPHTYFQEAIQIFHIASYYCHFRVGTVGWIPEQDMTAQMETNLAFFARVVHLMLYGLLPRETHPQETPFICN